MNNEEAMDILVARRDASNAAIQELARYRRESDNWKLAVRTSRIDAIKKSARAAGVDISAWDGTPAPPPK